MSATLHRPSVPSAHFAGIRHGADGRHRLQVAAVHVSHFAHFAQAECSLGAFCLCTPGLDAVQMDDTDSKLRRCKLSGGRKCLRHSIAVANPGPPYPTPIQRHRCYFPLQFSTVSKQGGFNYMRSEEWKQPRWQVLSSVLGAAWTARRRSTSHATL